MDAFDAYPQDPERAFDRLTPAGKEHAFYTLVFEDNWPRQGDYDMNDLVVQFRQKEVLNAQGQVKELYIEGQIVARGAELHNAFAMEFTGVKAEALGDAAIALQGQSATLSAEKNQQYLVLNLLPDASKMAPGTPDCRFFNTQSHCPIQKAADFQFKLAFKNPQLPENMRLNPFIYRKDQRGHEVHLPNYPPTSLADVSLFGQGDDGSNPAQGRYCVTKNNLPWGLYIPDSWDHPEEGKQI
ncbi:MAG: LruC domain-containing protein [Candidatus Sericytochromatia bacterium]|nr:LruC domain-containing protein [Candidatus Sericytochromatia bacterium]